MNKRHTRIRHSGQGEKDRQLMFPSSTPGTPSSNAWNKL